MKLEMFDSFDHVERDYGEVRFYVRGDFTALIMNGVLYYKKNKSPFFNVFCEKYSDLFSKRVQKKCIP